MDDKMNNAQMFYKYIGTGSDGTHQDAAKKLVAAAEKYFELRGARCTDERVNAAWFAMLPASPALVYDIGEVVQLIKESGGVPHYGIVSGYTTSRSGGYTNIRVKSDCDTWVNGEWMVSPSSPDQYRLSIPKELMDIIRMKLAANCPLKEVACGR